MPLPALVPVTPENADLHLFVGGSHMLQSAKFEWIGTLVLLNIIVMVTAPYPFNIVKHDQY